MYIRHKVYLVSSIGHGHNYHRCHDASVFVNFSCILRINPTAMAAELQVAN